MSSLLEDQKLLQKVENGVTMEPFEHLVIDTPDEYTGAIIEKLGKKKATMTNMVPMGEVIQDLNSKFLQED